MQLLVTAPIRVDFTLNSSQTAFKNDNFFEFWNNVYKKDYKDSNFDSINYYKKTNDTIQKSSYDDSSKTNLAILGFDTLNISNKILNSLKSEDKFINSYFNTITKSEIKLYDNTVAIVDLRFKLNSLDNKELDFTNDCENRVKIVLTKLLESISNSLKTFFTFLKKSDTYNIIQPLNNNKEYDDFVDFYKEKGKNLDILWASCALRYEKDSINKKLIDTWLKNSVDEQSIEYIKSNSDSFSLDWLKYLFREDVENYEDLWETMFLAQYCYAVIEVIIYNLRLIINESYRINKEKKSILNIFEKNIIIDVNRKLEAINETSYLHIIEYKDIKKYLKRSNLSIFENILEAWTFNDLVDNTQELLSTVKQRVDLIYNKISTKNNFYTDILLTFIGFFAIIDLVLSFSQYSREYTADAMISSRASDENSVLHYLSTIPIDTFIGSGFIISFILLIVYFIYRKRILP